MTDNFGGQESIKSLLGEALVELKRTRAKLEALEEAQTEDIAIIGMGCRFPGNIYNPQTFWQLLADGVDAITEIPATRWDVDHFYAPHSADLDKMYTKHGGFLNDVDQFDPQFFGISPREAIAMDPQQRLLLEVSWEALEYAGLAAQQLRGSQTGIFIGLSTDDYAHLIKQPTNFGYGALGTSRGIAIGRLAYLFDWHGPAMQVDTTCSSSLQAIHLACGSLRTGECNLALAGGVNLMLKPEATIALSQLKALAPDGRCKTFDASANGYSRGEGCGVVVLKRLSDAVADGDNILAVIRASGVNHDGQSNGLTAPNRLSQENLLRTVLSKAKISPKQIQYIEAHGTGTILGDPIEVLALNQVLAKERSRQDPLYIGTVKSNMGHLEAAAGVAGLMKVVLALQYGQLPPNLHFNQPNPHIPWDRIPITVPTKLTPWPDTTGERMAGVSSFGMSGTNVHIVLAEAPKQAKEQGEPGAAEQVGCSLHLLTLSAKNKAALQELAARYEQYIATHLNEDLADICFTANTGRSHFNHRLALVAETTTQLQQYLHGFITDQNPIGWVQGRSQPTIHPKTAFLFTGQGSQYINMGRQLYESQLVFRETLNHCAEILLNNEQISLIDIIYPEDQSKTRTERSRSIQNPKPVLSSVEGAKIDQTACTQPALFALEYALAELWKSWGINPDYVLGHSVGEYVAACIAGVFSLEDALKLIAARGRLMQALSQQGMMAAVMANEQRVVELIGFYPDRLSVAAVNGPEHIVVSGEKQAVQEIIEQLTVDGVKTVPLSVSHAFHSPLMEPMLAEFEEVAQEIHYAPPKIKLISNVTGQIIGDDICHSRYWVKHIRETVRFAEGMKSLHQAGVDIFVEVGPKPTLLGMGRHVLPDHSAGWLPTLRAEKDDWQQLLTSLGELYARGVNLNWAGFEQNYLMANRNRPRKVILPTYPFQRQHYWITRETNYDAQNQMAQIKKWLYQISWRPQPEQPKFDTASTVGGWLILADQNGLGQALAKQMRDAGGQPHLIYPVTYRSMAGPSDWIWDPAEPMALAALIEQKIGAEPLCGVVHLWALDGPSEIELNDENLVETQRINCSSTLQVVQHLAQTFSQVKPTKLWIVTQGAQMGPSDDPGAKMQVAQSPLWGLGRAIAWEHPELWGGMIDLSPESTTTQPVEAALILTELLNNSQEPQIAFRNQQRYVARLVQTLPNYSSSLPVEAEATYLITGGTGALGLRLACWLVEQGARHLVLTSRHGVTNSTQQQIIAHLAATEAIVEVRQVDVADAVGMSHLITELATADPALRGLIHAAGVLDDGILLNQSWSRFETVLRAKMSGSWLLHTLTQTLDLDFFVLFSSATALIGAMGQGNYAAANSFLDALALFRQQQGLPGLSINWGPWAEAGMAVQHRQVGLNAIQTLQPEEGIAALRYLIGAQGQVAVLPVDWSTSALSSTVNQSFLSEWVGQTAESDTKLARMLAKIPANEQRDILQSYLQDAVARILGLAERPSLKAGFAEMGMDSLMALELKKQLDQSLGQVLPPTIAFEYPTIETLSNYLLAEMLPDLPESPTEIVQAGSRDGQAEPIAIVGIGCRFPGADTPEAFWNLLRDGVDLVTDIPSDRWNLDAYYDPMPATPGKMYIRTGTFVRNVDHFDPQFFGISPREAKKLDPQQRLLLEVCWEALERAGQPPKQLSGSQTGIFVGISQNDYANLVSENDDLMVGWDAYTATGNGLSFAAGRLSHVLGLHGPALVVDTACSSSLVAVHLACQSLQSGECDLALAGGVQLILSPKVTIALSQMQALAADGRCKTFDAAADGFGRGEGCGVIVLKRLSEATAAGDNILAVIRGSAVNHDGPSSGLTVPNKLAQEALLKQALSKAQIEPHQIGYLEAHGTGTALGDPIEMRALGAVFGQQRTQPLWVGSVKTNIGHLEAAAGIASLIKVALSLHYGQLVPHLHFKQPNPHIDWDNLPVKIPTAPTPWPPGQKIAGVSSFGMSGTNAHLILETSTVPEALNHKEAWPWQIFTLSAKSERALKSQINQYYDYVITHPDTTLADICHTANTGREHFTHRLSVTVPSVERLRAKLAALIEGQVEPSVYQGVVEDSQPAPKVAFLFPGQGSQYISMGQELYEIYPTFRYTLDHCADILNDYLDVPLLDILYPDRPGRQVAGSQGHNDQSLISQTIYTQPTLFAIEYALAELWKSWGIQPDFVLGHSVGEYVAACMAGVFSLEDGLKLTAARGQLMQALPHASDGTMVVVMADETSVNKFIAPYPDNLSIAAINGPENVVISGQKQVVQAVVEQLVAAGIKTNALTASHAFHSPLMEPMLADFEYIAQEISYAPPQIRLISNVTGLVASNEVCQPDYWVNHIRQPVRFADSIETLHWAGASCFIEVGPEPILLGLGRQCLPDHQGVWLPSLCKGKKDGQQMLNSLGELYAQGAAVSWNNLSGDFQRKITLPTYPFQRQRYWMSDSKQQRRSEPLRPLIDTMMKSPLLKEIAFETAFSATALPFLTDHQVLGTVISPGACHIAMVLNGAELAFDSHDYHLTDILFPEMLIVPEDEARIVQLLFTPIATDPPKLSTQFQLISFTTPDETEKPASHATGYIVSQSQTSPSVISLNDLGERCSETVSPAKLYEFLAKQQIMLGPNFRWIEQLWRGEGEVLGRLRMPEGIPSLSGYVLHPGLLDACFQVTGGSYQMGEIDAAYLPFSIAALHLYQTVHGDEWWCHARQVDQHKWDIHLLDTTGQILVEIVGFETHPASPESLLTAQAWTDWLYQVTWLPRPLFGLPPDYLPTPDHLRQHLTRLVNDQPLQIDLNRYQEATPELEAVSLAYVLAAFATSGFTFQVGTQWRTEQVAQQVGVVPQHHRLLHRLLEILAEADILYQTDDGWQVAQTPGINSQQQQIPPAERMRYLQENYGAVAEAELTLLARCGGKLSEVLRGLQEPLELLFPDGDASITTKLYQESPGAKVMNGLVQQAVLAAIEPLPAEQGLRILEIGAGTGGTTAWLLPHLPPAQTEYVFSDIDSNFLNQAQEKFSAYDFVSYQRMDIEQSPLAQGFEGHHYDLIIAANVLHATRDLRQTLAHIRQLLAPGGLLVLWEGTQRSRRLDLIFGLTEGWWRFADERRDYPLLTSPEWQDLLLDCGFQSSTSISDEMEFPPHLGQTLIVAQASRTPTHKENVWLLFADDAGLGSTLAAILRQRGERAIVVYAAQQYRQLDDETFYIRANVSEDYLRLVGAVSPVAQIVHLWSLDAHIPHDPGDLELASQRGCGTALALAQALLQTPTPPPSLGLVTRNAHVVDQADQLGGLAQASLWGLGRAINLEHPELNCVLIDLDETDPLETQAHLLWSELKAVRPHAKKEEQVSLRQGQRYVARLIRHQMQASLPRPNEPYQLATTQSGSLDSLTLKPVSRRHLEPGEVEIRVHATGLNFIDVLDALGAAPYQRDSGLGGECTGDVVAVGDGVHTLQIGDRVVAVAPGAFSQYVIVPVEWALPLPDPLSFAEGATIPVNFLTAFYTLSHLASISAGNKVLIHAAAGGTGLAAVQLAQQAGAEVFATASPGKWKALQALGIQHIYNSRTLDFAAEVLADTNGHGVNIVLNSLTGVGFIAKSLTTLAPEGTFLEIAGRGVWSVEKVKQDRPDVHYHQVNLHHLIKQKPAQIQSMLENLLQQFADGRLKSLPQTHFPIEEALQAFRYMQQAKHIGKVVISHTPVQPVIIKDEATYLITGGLGGLGLTVAQWLVDQGARQLVLVGRSQPKPDTQVQLDELIRLGVSLTISQADVTELEQMRRVIEQIETQAPLRGIIHTAGVLDDGVLLQQNWERFANVLAPKVWGAWNLHLLTQTQPLDFFVLFSSAAGLLGNFGQANYAAANSFLDALAHYRRGLGLPALSIDWGIWSEIGAAAAIARQEKEQLTARGQGLMSPEQGVAVLGHLLPQKIAQIGVLPINWPQFFKGQAFTPPFLEALAQQREEKVSQTTEQPDSFRQQLAQASVEERPALLTQHLQMAAAKVLGLPSVEDVDPRRGLTELGLDSLMAIELRNLVARMLDHQLPATLLFSYPTIEALTDHLLQTVLVIDPQESQLDQNKSEIMSSLSSNSREATSHTSLEIELETDVKTIAKKFAKQLDVDWEELL
ncbi:MAG: SDR family NAD(P)-dependent oxidoreductase [Gammaproteobacteria bacterium]|nr:SDR family NAD(P)-dependent oxidoreductase [Gammaproteobacteria bacterium]